MAKRGPKGYWYCRFCDRWDCDPADKNESALYQYQTQGKFAIYHEIVRVKTVSLQTLRRRFHDIARRDFHRFLKQLETEGKIEIQQSGFAADSIHHEKLVVAL